MLRASLVLALILLAPLAGAQQTLSSLEEPQQGTDLVIPVEVTEEEAGQWVVIFRNPPRTVFRLFVYDELGETLYEQNATRGVQTLPNLSAGPHKFFIQRTGEFQITKNAFERTIGRSVQTTLNGTDTYVFSPRSPACVEFTGDVQVEWWNMVAGREDITPPAFADAGTSGSVYVMTVRGTEGTPYGIELQAYDDRCHTGHEETPGVGLAALVLLVAAVAVMRRGRKA